MIRIKNVDVYNWHNAIRGMRNPMQSWDKMDSSYSTVEAFTIDTMTGKIIDFNGKRKSLRFVMGPNDYNLAMRLSKAGNDHAKYLRQILVSCDITAPMYWWKEFDTYKIGTVANSTSLMHKLGTELLTVEDFSFDEPDHPYVQDLIDKLNTLIRMWQIDDGMKPGTPTWRLLNQLMPSSYNYLRTVSLNYQVLKNIYHSRKNHKLQEWRDFCKWIESLPYSELITLKEVK